MVLLDHDRTAILAEPVKSRSAHELLRTYTLFHTKISNRGVRPLLQILNKECPVSLKKFMHKEIVNYQFVQPHLHRNNVAEISIQTYKGHIIAGLSSCDRNFHSISGTAFLTRPHKH